MNIYFNRRPVKGPWGGGSKVLSSIIEACRRRGHALFFEEEVIYNDFDILFCIDPRPNHVVNYDSLLLCRSQSRRNCKIIQRIGDLGTHGKPELLDLVKRTSMTSDVLVFPSKWALETLATTNKNKHVILNAPLPDFIKKRESIDINSIQTLKIVTHHWSDNTMKGFDVYKILEDFCNQTNRKNIDFTYIGRKPSGVSIKNHIPPLDVQGLVEELPKHHIYITASRLEAGANHVLEAIGLGLPVLYHVDGGSINEYCRDFGLSYSSSSEAVDLLKNARSELEQISKRVYTRTSVDMASDYVDLFERSI